jgi:1-deoxy-D-xylulose-5-phosphate reductoisomerase
MSEASRNVAILGSTGSIGGSTLQVIAELPDRLRVIGLTAHRRMERLQQQANDYGPRWIVITDPKAHERSRYQQLPDQTKVFFGHEQISALVQSPEVDVVVSAIVGSAGLTGTWAAVEAGKTVALANKETLVVAGPLIMDLAHRTGANILPVDSEHSAVFQALQAGKPDEVSRVILTASGGPFRELSRERMQHVTPEQALDHPTWDMGPKITIDSATMMNKAFEVIEARWLFGLEAGQIDVVVHPQSIVHSMVEFNDGAVMAQLSPPDMRLPIQYALTYPNRLSSPTPSLDLSKALELEFIPADPVRFPALELGHEVAEQGGTTGAVLNAANEAAVGKFLNRQLGFTEIVPTCRSILNHHNYDPNPSLEELLRLDQWAREEVSRWV